MGFWVVQPYGKDKGRDASRISEHPTVTAAFEAIDLLRRQMQRTGVSSDAIELLVVNDQGQIVSRPGLH